MFTFNKKYFILTLVLFFIEVIIGVFVHDKIIRPFIGDLLVVILIYCFVKSFFKISVIKAAVFVLLFSYTVEILQYFKFVKYLGLQHSRFAQIIFGNSFSWIDMLMYTIGFAIILIAENVLSKKLVIKQ
jgi:Protein of unknown function (DUF2809)